MSDDGLNFNNLNEFMSDINQVANEFPLESEKCLQKIGNKFKKIIKEKSPDSGKATKELIKKMFLSGEIEDLYNKISELSGYEEDDDETDEEIKN